MVLIAPAGADLPGTNAPVGALIGRPTWRSFDVRRWGRRRFGVAAVIAVFAALGTLNALTVPPLVPRDETGHIAYVVSITHGVLPTISTPLPKDDVPQLRTNHKDTTWVANHPPLFYVLAAVPMEFALMVHRPMLGLRLIRLMNVGFVMVTMALAAVLARRLLRRSARAPIVAAATTGLVGTVPHTAAMLYNDALAMLTAAALMVAVVALFDRGPTKRTLAWVAGCASAAALSRFTNFAVIVPAGAVVVAGVWRHAGGSVSRRATAVLRAGVMVGVPVALTSAWFYLRNKHLYGDFTGAHDLLVMFHRRAHGSAESFLVSGRFWRSIHDELWTRYARAQSSLTYGHGWPIRLGRLLSLFVAAGLVCAAVRWLWLRRTARSPLRWSPDLTLGLAGVGQLAVLLVMMAQFASGGGSAHSRYLFPFLPVIGCFVALAWACLPGNRHGVLSAGALVASVGLAVDLLHRFLVLVVGDHGWVGTEHHALSVALPGSAIVLSLVTLVLAAGLAVAVWVLITLPGEQLLRRPRGRGDAATRSPDLSLDGGAEADQIGGDDRTGVRHQVGQAR